MFEITIANLKTWKTCLVAAVYIGRPMRYRNGSALGNPFKLAKNASPGERARCIEKYDAWLDEKLKSETPQRKEMQLLAKIAQDEPLTLLCWCKQEGMEVACHGDSIKKRLLQMIADGQSATTKPEDSSNA